MKRSNCCQSQVAEMSISELAWGATPNAGVHPQQRKWNSDAPVQVRCWGKATLAERVVVTHAWLAA